MITAHDMGYPTHNREGFVTRITFEAVEGLLKEKMPKMPPDARLIKIRSDESRDILEFYFAYKGEMYTVAEGVELRENDFEEAV